MLTPKRRRSKTESGRQRSRAQKQCVLQKAMTFLRAAINAFVSNHKHTSSAIATSHLQDFRPYMFMFPSCEQMPVYTPVQSKSRPCSQPSHSSRVGMGIFVLQPASLVPISCRHVDGNSVTRGASPGRPPMAPRVLRIHGARSNKNHVKLACRNRSQNSQTVKKEWLRMDLLCYTSQTLDTKMGHKE